MPTNLEIKASVADIFRAVEVAHAIGARDMGILRQTDTYFCVQHGRLKLREIAGREAELIYYERDESGSERMSDFTITPVPDPDALRRSLAAAMGLRGVVAKTRRLFMLDATRIHLDEVEGLGPYLEFEVPVAGDLGQAEATLHRLEREFGIAGEQYYQNSYIDLLEGKRP